MTLGTGDMEDNNGKVAVVTGAAGGAIQIDTGRVDVQPVQTRLQQYGDM